MNGSARATAAGHWTMVALQGLVLATGIAACAAFLSVGPFRAHAFNTAPWAMPTVPGMALILYSPRARVQAGKRRASVAVR